MTTILIILAIYTLIGLSMLAFNFKLFDNAVTEAMQNVSTWYVPSWFRQVIMASVVLMWPSFVWRNIKEAYHTFTLNRKLKSVAKKIEKMSEGKPDEIKEGLRSIADSLKELTKK